MTAYGKDASILRNVGSFRQLSGQFSGGRANKSSKGGAPYFIDQYKPPVNDSDTIALVAGQYEHLVVDDSGDKPVAVPVVLPFVQFREHFDGSSDRSAICSAGPFVAYKDLRNACNGCDIYWATLEPGEDGKKRSTRMSRQQKFAFSVIDFSDYHKEPQFDQNGKPKVSPRTNKQYFNWVKCEGRGCDACKAKLETKFGHNPHWPMSWGYFQTLRENDRLIGKSCRSCGGVETIQSEAWICKGCGAAAIDMSETQLKTDDITKISESHFSCPCGHTDFLDEIIKCTSCSHGDRMTMFDVEFKVMRIPTGQNNQSMLSISNWVRRRPLTGDLLELGKAKELLKIFASTDNKKQLDRFGPPPLGQNSLQTPPEEQSRAYGDQYRA